MTSLAKNLVGKILTFLTLLAILDSCSKGSGTVPVTPTPPVIPKPVFTWSVSEDDTIRKGWAFLGETKTLSVSVVNANDMSIIGTGGATTINTGVLTKAVKYTASAKDFSGKTVTEEYTLGVFSQDTTSLCWDFSTLKYAMWENTEGAIKHDDYVDWQPLVIIDAFKMLFYPNGERAFFVIEGGAINGGAHYQISKVGNDTYINLNEVGQPLNLYKIESLTERTMVLTQYQTDMKVTRKHVWTKSK